MNESKHLNDGELFEDIIRKVFEDVLNGAMTEMHKQIEQNLPATPIASISSNTYDDGQSFHIVLRLEPPGNDSKMPDWLANVINTLASDTPPAPSSERGH